MPKTRKPPTAVDTSPETQVTASTEQMLENIVKQAQRQQAILKAGTRKVATVQAASLVPYFTGEALAQETVAALAGQLGEDFLQGDQAPYLQESADIIEGLVLDFDHDTAQALEEEKESAQQCYQLLSGFIDNRLRLGEGQETHNPLSLPSGLIEEDGNLLTLQAAERAPQLTAAPPTKSVSDGDPVLETWEAVEGNDGTE